MKTLRFLSPVILILMFVGRAAAAETEVLVPAPQTAPPEIVSVEDASDGAYLDKVLALIGQAKKSVDVSMYVSNPGSSEKHPVAQLFQALSEAVGRGVKVRVWMNNDFSEEKLLDRKKFDEFWPELKAKGLDIRWISSEKRLHDKLIVVDAEYIVEGSTNWTYSALKKNFESATLIRSQALARKKIERLETFPLAAREELNVLQSTFVELPAELLTDAGLLPKMASKNDRQAWNLYFDLAKRSRTDGPGPWTLGLEDSRAKVLKPLKRLEKDYRLLSFEYLKKEKEFRITLLDPASAKGKKSKKEAPSILGSRPWAGRLRIPLAFYEYGYQKKWSLEAQFAYGVSLVMVSESKTKPYWMSPMYQLEDRFHVGERLLRGGLNELKRDNALEYVFPKKGADESRRSARLLVSYRNNVLRSEEDKETELLKVRNVYPSLSSEEWKRARAYAGVFDDPYDGALVRQFVNLVKKYPESKLEPVIQRVAQFAPENSLRSPDYVKRMLEKK